MDYLKVIVGEQSVLLHAWVCGYRDDRKLLHDTDNTGYCSTLGQGGGGGQAFKGL